MLEQGLVGASLTVWVAALFLLPRYPRNWWLWTFLVSGWLSLTTLAKTSLIQNHLDTPINLPLEHWLWQAFSLIGCVVLCQLVSRRHWSRLVWFIQLGLGTIFLIDQLYERYFDDIPGLYLITQIGQAKAVLPSTINLLRREDLLFVLDLVLALPLLRFAPPPAPGRSIMFPVACLPFVVSVFMGLSIDADNMRILRLRFRNVAAVERLGLFHYHAYDLLQILYSRWENIYDSDFDRKTLTEMVGESRASIEHAGSWFGRYKGKNLLVFQLESFEQFVYNLKVDGQEVTPFLNELGKESWVGGLQDQSGQGRSSDGEFILLNSLLPPGERPLVYAYPSNYYHGLPALLAEQGYYTSYAVAYYGSFWNARYMSKRYGFKRSLFREQLPTDETRKIGWGMNDEGLVRRLQVYWKTFEQPFFAYTVTMMGHHPYKELRPDQEQLKLGKAFEDRAQGGYNMLGRYLQLCRERDTEWRRIAFFLKQKGLWQNSIIVLVGDHDARIPNDEMSLVFGRHKFDEVSKVEQDKVFCLIHTPDGALRGKGDPLAAQMDLAPTLLHLLGATRTQSAMLGQNLLVPMQRKSVVSKSGYAIDRDHVVLDENGIPKAYSRRSHTSVAGQESPALQDMARWYDLTRDILRLNLVAEMRSMRKQPHPTATPIP